MAFKRSGVRLPLAPPICVGYQWVMRRQISRGLKQKVIKSYKGSGAIYSAGVRDALALIPIDRAAFSYQPKDLKSVRRAVRTRFSLGCPSRKSYPHVAMVQSGKNWRGGDRSAPLDSSP